MTKRWRTIIWVYCGVLGVIACIGVAAHMQTNRSLDLLRETMAPSAHNIKILAGLRDSHGDGDTFLYYECKPDDVQNVADRWTSYGDLPWHTGPLPGAVVTYIDNVSHQFGVSDKYKLVGTLPNLTYQTYPDQLDSSKGLMYVMVRVVDTKNGNVWYFESTH